MARGISATYTAISILATLGSVDPSEPTLKRLNMGDVSGRVIEIAKLIQVLHRVFARNACSRRGSDEFGVRIS